MKIGILQTGHMPEELAPEHGEYPRMFERLLEGHGFEFRTFAVVDGVFPESIDQCDGWLITGSRHGAYEDHAWIPPLEAFIRAVHEARIPLAGICFGHQIMAQALGGEVEKFAGGWGVGRMRYETADGDTLSLNAMHQDQVVAAPDGSRTLFSSEFCRHAALAYGDHAISFQPHPEFDDAVTEALIRIKSPDSLDEDKRERALGSFGEASDSTRLAAMIAGLYKKAARDKAA